MRRYGGQAFLLSVILTLVSVCVYGQDKVYRWVDEDGVIHVGDKPPDQPQAVEFETHTRTPAPVVSPAAQPAVKAPEVSAAATNNQSVQREIEPPPSVERIDITKMSLPDLDRRCEDARDRKIAPLREAEIAKCQQEKRTDPAWCVSFNADYGDGGRTGNGNFRPRMFGDLPECVEALGERNRRGL